MILAAVMTGEPDDRKPRASGDDPLDWWRERVASV